MRQETKYAKSGQVSIAYQVLGEVFCLGCCWALMLLMFAAGVANLWWMAALTAVMVYEKVGRRGAGATRPVGVLLLVLALLVLLHPAWLPSALTAA